MKKSNKKNNSTKFIIVTGGVLSGIGKGITAASLGALLNCAGLKVTAQKIDHYLNVDAGTLNPKEHGECFVTADGTETDLDLGHYERFLGSTLNKNSITIAGKLMQELTRRERDGKYLGKTIQLIPHFTNLIKEKIKLASNDSDIHIVELGGTVGDYEAMGAIEGVSQLAVELGWSNFLFVHVGYVPFLKVSGEFKTKPLQNSVRDLREFGIAPKLLIARTEEIPIGNQEKYIEEKCSQFVGLPPEQIVVLPNADTIYRVPETLYEKKIHEFILNKFKIKFDRKKLAKNVKERWGRVLDLFEKVSLTPDPSPLERGGVQKVPEVREVKIGIVAKYLENADSYYSVIESLKIASWHAGVKLKYEWVDAENPLFLKAGAGGVLGRFDGVLVPGGFGSRGIEGKIAAARYSLENKKPYLGICLGLQVAVIAAARMAGLKEANSEEFRSDWQKITEGSPRSNVVYIMNDQVGKENTGGTMRLGTYKCFIKKDTLAHKTFAKQMKERGEKDFIEERHRHRYEVNRKFEKEINDGGLIVSGTSKDGKLVELIEAKKNTDEKLNHPFFLATQSHPEFLSRPWAPHPMFLEFIAACK